MMGAGNGARPAKRTTVDVFQFLHYRPYFRAVYEELKQVEERFSFRSLQRRAGFSDRANHFWQVLNGSVRLTVEAADKYAGALGLSAAERNHLRGLVALEAAKSDAEREPIITRILSSSRFLSEKRYLTAMLVLYSDALLPVLLTAAELDTFRDDPAWLAARYFTTITPAEIAAGLKKLEDHGLLVRDETGRLRPAPINLSDYQAAARETGEAMRTMRRTQIRKAMFTAFDAMDHQPFGERVFYCSSFAVPEGCYEELKERVLSFQEDLKSIALKHGGPKDALYQCNLQFYAPLKLPADKE